MTPDMKRLCEAAERAHDDWVKGGYSVKPGEHTIEAAPEAIVRAVLMALREPEDDTLKRGVVTAIQQATDLEGGEADDRYGPMVRRSFVAMIDAILAEPAKA